MASANPQADPVFPEEDTFFPHPLEARWGAPGKPSFATLLGFSLGSQLSLPPPSPPPRVANRDGLVLAPIELPCSLHTKNGNPQAISGAMPSPARPWPRLPCSRGLLDFPPSLAPSSAHSRAASGTPLGALDWEELTWAEGSSPAGRMAAGWWEELSNVAWAQASRSVSQPVMYGLVPALHQPWCSWQRTIVLPWFPGPSRP